MRFRYKQLVLLVILPLYLFAIDYSVDFEVAPPKSRQLLISELERSSSTKQLSDKPPPTLNGIKRRIDTDQQTFREILWAYGFFSSTIKYEIKEKGDAASIKFIIDAGPQYRFGKLTIQYLDDSIDTTISLLPTPLLRGAVRSEMIDAGAREIVAILRARGYPLAKIINHRLIAHPETHLLDVLYVIEKGPLCLFGDISIVGTSCVLPSYIRFLSTCKTAAPFSSRELEETLTRLEKSGLFQSVNVIEGASTSDLVPVTITVTESPRRTVGAGLSYTTTYGPGLSAQWAHRNFHGAGEELSFRANLWRKNQAATLRYFRPHVREYRRNIAYVLEYDKNTTLAYISHAAKASTFIEQDFKKDIEFLKGLELGWMDVNGFNGHQNYRLIRVPLQLKVSSANNLLDPTRGCSFNCRLTPTLSFHSATSPYLIHLSSFSLYKSVANDHCTFAGRIMMGNIFARDDHAIPLPDRFFGGSENALRGYKNLTVAPLNHQGIPMGGRSLLTGTLEMRLRSRGNVGWALFWDAGQVFLNDIPTLNTKYLHSLGIGFRYKTPLGPLRLDVALPLNRRPSLDPPFQIYFSIGQSF